MICVPMVQSITGLKMESRQRCELIDSVSEYFIVVYFCFPKYILKNLIPWKCEHLHQAYEMLFANWSNDLQHELFQQTFSFSVQSVTPELCVWYYRSDSGALNACFVALLGILKHQQLHTENWYIHLYIYKTSISTIGCIFEFFRRLLVMWLIDSGYPQKHRPCILYMSLFHSYRF